MQFGERAINSLIWLRRRCFEVFNAFGPGLILSEPSSCKINWVINFMRDGQLAIFTRPLDLESLLSLASR